MKLTSITPILNVSDVPASLAWFERLGWTRSFSWNGAGMIAEAAIATKRGPPNSPACVAAIATSSSATTVRDRAAVRVRFMREMTRPAAFG